MPVCEGASLAEPPETTAPDPVACPPGRWRRRVGLAVGACSCLYLVTVLGLWALLGVADLWWPATLFLFSPRWLLALPSLLLLPAAGALRPRAVAPVLCGLVLVLGPVMGFSIPWQRLRSDPPPGRHFRVLTCNMHYHPVPPEPLDQLLAAERPDIVVLQEWRGPGEFKSLAGDAWHIHRVRGLFLASNYPLRQATRLGNNSSGEQASVMRYELETPAGVVTLFSLHLASPREGLAKVVHERGQAPDDLEASSQLRWKQSEYLAREAATVAGPVLLAGDFNTPPESAIFRRLWGRYTDAFGAAGWGWGYTFFGGRTRVRIDHILAGPGWHCDRCWVGPDVGSAHRPVLADLTWPTVQE
jgi:vancomycin resistance protein VanJ